MGVVYLNGTIASGSASSVIKGLNEVADDDDIRSVILRIDSGGGERHWLTYLEILGSNSSRPCCR